MLSLKSTDSTLIAWTSPLQFRQPLTASLDELERQAHAAAASTRTVMDYRNHCNACVGCGCWCCRYAKPSSLVECTGMRMVGLCEEIVDYPDPRTEHFDVLMPVDSVERPKHNYDRDPVESLDSKGSCPLNFCAMPCPFLHRLMVPAPMPALTSASACRQIQLTNCRQTYEVSLACFPS